MNKLNWSRQSKNCFVKNRIKIFSCSNCEFDRLWKQPLSFVGWNEVENQTFHWFNKIFTLCFPADILLLQTFKFNYSFTVFEIVQISVDLQDGINVLTEIFVKQTEYTASRFLHKSKGYAGVFNRISDIVVISYIGKPSISIVFLPHLREVDSACPGHTRHNVCYLEIFINTQCIKYLHFCFIKQTASWFFSVISN